MIQKAIHAVICTNSWNIALQTDELEFQYDGLKEAVLSFPASE